MCVHVSYYTVTVLSEPDDSIDESAEEYVEDDTVGNCMLEDINSQPDDIDNSIIVQNNSEKTLALAKWIILFVLTLQSAYHLSSTAVHCIIQFLKEMFRVLSQFSSEISELFQVFPTTYRVAYKKFISPVKFSCFVVCRKCYSLYTFKNCIEGNEHNQRSKICEFKPYPNHPHRRMRQACQSVLLKTVELSGGKRFFYPLLMYCYVGIQNSLQHIIKQENFFKLCEEWRDKFRDDCYRDVYSGKMWKTFINVDEKPFLSQPNNLALLLNMDFFQPFKHVKGYSVGAIYCVILNLPRSVRYLRKNVILIGLIPGPKEPDHDINTFLNPFVEELNMFWKGVEMYDGGHKTLIRCALLCVACDLPAGRKVCGFLGHAAHYGCSRCKKKFTGSIGSMDYSGFDRATWPNRCGKLHQQVGLRMRNFQTIRERDSEESKQGLRYSPLLKLPYFDAPRMLIVDPMHNLFLGSAKYVLQSIWIERNFITNQDFNKIQDWVDKIMVPTGIGRIPYKINSGFSCFTADQWKNWTLYYSLLVLHDVLDTEHLECWRHFVLACRLLCRKILTTRDLQLADALIMQFCKRTEQLYGKEAITPNMHMHAHLRSCIEDYGPIHSFWLYAFERYNGLFEKIPNNNRCIEPQLVQHFIQDNIALLCKFPTEFSEFERVLPYNNLKCPVGSLADTLSCEKDHDSATQSWEYHEDSFILCKSRSRYSFMESQSHLLKLLYSKLFSLPLSSIEMSNFCWKYKSVKINEETIGSHKTISQSSSIVAAWWNIELFGKPLSSIVEGQLEPGQDLLRPAKIKEFYLHQFNINGTSKTILLVSLSWYQFHPKMLLLGKPLTIWCSSIFETQGLYSIVPIQMIKCRTVSTITDIDHEHVLIMCPCIEFF